MWLVVVVVDLGLLVLVVLVFFHFFGFFRLPNLCTFTSQQDETKKSHIHIYSFMKKDEITKASSVMFTLYIFLVSQLLNHPVRF